MDTLTHIALGACAGEIVLGKRLGRRAALTGAFANSIPDLDFIAGLWLDTDDNLLAHRGFTHSFLFTILAAFFFAFIFERWFRRRTIHFRDWVLFFAAEILLHVFIDAFNNYGTGWYEPFSHARVSFHTIFVADPFFSIWIGIGLLAIIICKTHHARKIWSIAGLSLSSVYLVYCVWNKTLVEEDVQAALKQQHISYNKYFTTPTPLNNWLWFAVAGNDSGFYVAHRSVFDTGKAMQWHFFSTKHYLLDSIEERGDVKNLLRFSQGFYTVEKWNDTLIFNDLRFGQMAGWERPRERFAFHYFVNLPDQNKVVVQRGRFAQWNKETIRRLWRRAMGKDEPPANTK